MKYHLWLTKHDGSTAFCVEVKAPDHGDALWAAETIAASVNDCFERYRLLHGQTVLLNGETRHTRFCLHTAVKVGAETQQAVLDTEEALLASGEAVFRSKRLQRAIGLLRSHIPTERTQ